TPNPFIDPTTKVHVGKGVAQVSWMWVFPKSMDVVVHDYKTGRRHIPAPLDIASARKAADAVVTYICIGRFTDERPPVVMPDGQVSFRYACQASGLSIMD